MNDRRARIVEAATTVMARQGFRQTSIDDVIKEAGLCGKGHFYHYFRSKEELGSAVLRHQFERFAERGLTILRDPTACPFDRLSRFIDMIVESYECQGCGGATPCGPLATEMAEKHESFRQQVEMLFDRWTAQLQAVLWEARPQLRDDVDIARLARFIVATIEGALFMSRVSRDGGETVLEGIADDLKRFVDVHRRSSVAGRAAAPIGVVS